MSFVEAVAATALGVLLMAFVVFYAAAMDIEDEKDRRRRGFTSWS